MTWKEELTSLIESTVCNALLHEYSYLFAQQPSLLSSLKGFYYHFDKKILII